MRNHCKQGGHYQRHPNSGHARRPAEEVQDHAKHRAADQAAAVRPSRKRDVTPRGKERHIRERGESYIVWSFGSLIRSAESSTTVLSPVFFHQCETSLVSATTSPALCTIGTAQLLAYSLISPSMM
jgi:hypothetical protein